MPCPACPVPRSCPRACPRRCPCSKDFWSLFISDHTPVGRAWTHPASIALRPTARLHRRLAVQNQVISGDLLFPMARGAPHVHRHAWARPARRPGGRDRRLQHRGRRHGPGDSLSSDDLNGVGRPLIAGYLLIGWDRISPAEYALLRSIAFADLIRVFPAHDLLLSIRIPLLASATRFTPFITLGHASLRCSSSTHSDGYIMSNNSANTMGL